jgi:hypothetical protein
VRRSVLLRAAAVGGAAAITAAALLPGSSTAAPTPPATTAASTYTAFTATGATGQPIAAGHTYSYAAPTVTPSGDTRKQTFTIRSGTAEWGVWLTAPYGQQLAPGRYRDADENATGREPGLYVYGLAASCNSPIYGSFDIEQIAFTSAGVVSMIEASFVQKCGSATAPALTGKLWYRATPLTFKYSADPGEFLTGGGGKTYTGSTSLFSTFPEGFPDNEVSYQVSAPRDGWLARLNPPTGQAQLAPGTYEVSAYGDTTRAGLDIGYGSIICDTAYGTLTIRSIAYGGSGFTALDASFVYHCQGAAPVLRGTIQYHAGTFPALPPAT